MYGLHDIGYYLTSGLPLNAYEIRVRYNRLVGYVITYKTPDISGLGSYAGASTIGWLPF